MQRHKPFFYLTKYKKCAILIVDEVQEVKLNGKSNIKMF